MIIRPEQPDDHQSIRYINTQAFDTEAEADLIDELLKSGIPLISLVAEENGEIVGHILFTPVTLEGNSPSLPLAGLAPMAVRADWQKRGVGSMLVKEGLNRCKKSGYGAVVVLGHPDYYPRFGFSPSVNYGITSEYDVPVEVFMVKELHDGALDDCTGTIKYHKAFGNI
jgi:putative acetyltransferase